MKKIVDDAKSEIIGIDDINSSDIIGMVSNNTVYILKRHNECNLKTTFHWQGFESTHSSFSKGFDFIRDAIKYVQTHDVCECECFIFSCAKEFLSWAAERTL